MSQINPDVNLHDIVMLVLNRSEFASTDPKPLAAEVAQKYIEIRRIILEELKQHANPGTMIVKPDKIHQSPRHAPGAILCSIYHLPSKSS